MSGGINQFAYVGNNSINATDPSGLYEIDVHYYLTKYLAQQTGCFDNETARKIAEGDQTSDEDTDRSPGAFNAVNNSIFHAIDSNAIPGVRSPFLWDLATRYHSVNALGISLHYLQDTFSHADYTNRNFGHSPLSWIDDFPFGKYGDHSADKTATDVGKALRMARYSYGDLAKFAREQCGCTSNPWNQSMEDTIRRFAEVDSGSPWNEIADVEGDSGLPVVGKRSGLADPAALRRKVEILQVDPR